jgi:hypothetical protein
VPEAGRLREQVENHERACTQVLFLQKAALVRRFQLSLAGTFHRTRSHLLKTGFFMQALELKIQRKNPGSDLLTARVARL